MQYDFIYFFEINKSNILNISNISLPPSLVSSLVNKNIKKTESKFVGSIMCEKRWGGCLRSLIFIRTKTRVFFPRKVFNLCTYPTSKLFF